ncbi:Ankyrin-2 [Xylographa bjoerkii]|nr:Ankyrin-2 [Xylographa bjoerkii]
MSLKVRGIITPSAEIFRLLLRDDYDGIRRLYSTKSASPNDVLRNTEGTALHYAIDTGRLKACKAILDAGGDPYLDLQADCHGSPFDQAWDSILSNQLGQAASNILRGLFPDRRRLEDREYTKLYKIVLDMVAGNLEEEIKKDPVAVNTPDQQDCTPVGFKKRRIGLDILLLAGADVNHKNVLGYNALHRTVSFTQNTKIIRALIRAGVSLNGQNNHGHNPLACAVLVSHAIAAETLLDHGAQINDCDHEGDTALMQSLYCSADNITQSLLRRGATYTTVNKNSDTILHHAARSGGLEIIQILQAAGLRGLDTEAVNKQKKTPLQLARERENVPDGFVARFQELLAAICELSRTESTGRINEDGQGVSDDEMGLNLPEAFVDAVEVQTE